MAYIGSLRYVHRQLMARNVLVGNGNCCKITGLGVTVLAVDGEFKLATRLKFPVKWSAPEVIKEGLFTTQSDVWSFGIVLSEMFSDGRIPYPGNTDDLSINKNIKKPYKL